MRPIALMSVPFVLATLVACVEDVGKDKVAATVEEVPTAPAKTEATTPAARPTETPLAVDTARSSIRALGAKVTATHPIDFKDFKGTVTVDGDTVTAVEFAVDMKTLESDHPKLTSHLKDEDFFFVEKFPKATFASAAVKPGAEEEGFTHTVSGDLTLRGQTKRVTFPAKIEVAAADVSASTEFVLDRTDFGIVYPGRKDDLIQDNVRMTIAFVAPKG